MDRPVVAAAFAGEASRDILDQADALLTERDARVLLCAETPSGAARSGTAALCARYDAAFFLQGLSSPPDPDALRVWIGHPHLRILRCPPDTGAAARLLADGILRFAGIPEPLEIERKFLVTPRDAQRLDALPLCRRTGIRQTYLPAGDGRELRLREHSVDGRSLCFLTEKKAVTSLRRVETERRLTAAEYRSLLSSAGAGIRSLVKTRRYLAYEGHVFEIDTYPDRPDLAILEIELDHEDEPVRFPPMLPLLREVTGDPAYRNAALARSPAGPLPGRTEVRR